MSNHGLSANTQIDAIYSMMDEGQHSVKMERHTLLIWGITAAILILVTDLIFNQTSFPIIWQKITAQSIFISCFLFMAGLWDLKLTRKVRQKRDESLSFTQLQLTKVWWFFVGLVVLLNIGMSVFGGGYMFYGMTMVLIGMAFYIQGLFSVQLLKWTGLMFIAIGIASIALNLHFLVTKWLTAGVFGLGLTSLAFILDKPMTHSTLLKRLLLSVVWFFIVIIPAVLVNQFNLNQKFDGISSLSFIEYKKLGVEEASKLQVIHFPKGTNIPVNFNIDADMFETTQPGSLKLKLTQDLGIVIQNGMANGYFKIGMSDWQNRIDHLRIRDFKMISKVEQIFGPSINIDFSLDVK